MMTYMKKTYILPLELWTATISPWYASRTQTKNRKDYTVPRKEEDPTHRMHLHLKQLKRELNNLPPELQFKLVWRMST